MTKEEGAELWVFLHDLIECLETTTMPEGAIKSLRRSLERLEEVLLK